MLLKKKCKNYGKYLWCARSREEMRTQDCDHPDRAIEMRIPGNIIMDVRPEENEEGSEDYRWLMKEAASGEFWFSLDTVVDWIKRREPVDPPRDEKQKK